MGRLTKQNIQNDGTTLYSSQQGYCVLLRCETNQKLGKLEDLEEQLGIPLYKIFSFLNNIIYVIDTNYKRLHIDTLRINSINKICKDYYFVCEEHINNNQELFWVPVKQKEILYFLTREEAKKEIGGIEK